VCIDVKPSNILVSFSDDDTRHLAELTLKHIPIERYPPRKVLGEVVEAIRSQPLPLPPLERRNPLAWAFKLTDFGSGTSAVRDLRTASHTYIVG
jgi:serine/threonine-protein kinase SRPK3